LVDEAKKLVDKGIKEINIIAQDSTNYGQDLYNQRRIVELVDNLHLKPLDKFDDKIEYLDDLLKTLTHKDHPLLVFMFFGTDHIKSDIYKKFKR
jgi:ribosomal protein S12 methylthiotransferase